jgi:AcrR family transcriptional regulator
MKRSGGRHAAESSSGAATSSSGSDGGGARAAILQAAVQLLRERGLVATRTRDVTALAGLSTGLLNHYFTWQALRAAALQQVLAEGLDELLPDAAATHPDPRLILDTLVEAVFAESADPLWRLWVEAVEAAPTDPTIVQAISDVSSGFASRLAACIVRGVELGVWRCADPDGSAFRLMALHDGLAGMLLTGIPGLTRAAAVTHMRTAFSLECAPPG